MAYDVETTAEYDRWFDGLRDPIAKKAVRRALVRLSAGLFGNVDPVGEGAHEYKVDLGAGYRAYFGYRDADTIVLVCGGDKSTQPADIKLAKKMVSEL